MTRYVVDVSFKGTVYAGWQIQENIVTVQAEVDKALSKVLRAPIATYGSGRTDSGVHAIKLPAHFDFEGDLPKHFMVSVNACLPRDIGIMKVYKAILPNFHARHTGRERAYRYHVIFQKDPLQFGFARWVKEELDIAAMQSAAKVLLDYNSFECFCKTNSNNKTYLCDIKASYFEWEGNRLVYHIRANRFLRGMVRTIMGTLLLVGRGLLDEDGLRKIIEGKDRTKAGPAEMAEGLYLSDVTYPEGSLEEIVFER